LHTLPEFSGDDELEVKTHGNSVGFGKLRLDRHSGEGPYVPGEWARLVQTETTLRILKKLAKAILSGEKVLLVGPTSSAKTSYIRYLAYLMRANFLRISLDAQTDTSELIGKYIPQENSAGFSWQDGVLIEAMKNGWWVLLDEINLAEPDILERFNSLLDDDGCLEVGENKGEKWLPAEEYDAKFYSGNAPENIHRIHQDFRIFAAMNPERYSGRNRLSLAMHNRLTEIWVPGLDPLDGYDMKEMIEIVEEYLDSVSDKNRLAVKMVKFHNRILRLKEEADGFDGGGLEGYQFTLRELKAWARYINIFSRRIGIKEAFDRGASYIYLDRLVSDSDRVKLLAIAKQFDIEVEVRIGKNSIKVEADKTSILGLGIANNTNVDYRAGNQEGRSLTYTPRVLQSLYKIWQSIILQDPVLLIGHTGVGKTSLVRHLAYLTNNRFYRLNLSGQTEKADLIGGYKPNEEGRFIWKDGALIEAMKNGWWLLLDEINLASPQIVERINSLLDEDASLVIREHKNEKWVSQAEYGYRIRKTIEEKKVSREQAIKILTNKGVFCIHPNFRLFATMNPAEYAGRKIFSPAFFNRFRIKWVDDFGGNDLAQIINEKFGKLLPADIQDKVLRFHKQMKGNAEKNNQQGSEEKISYTIRNLMRWLSRVNNYPGNGLGLNAKLAIEAREVYGDALRPDLEAHRDLIDEMNGLINNYFSRSEDSNYEISQDSHGRSVFFGDFPIEYYKGKNGHSVESNNLCEVLTTKKVIKKIAKAIYNREHLLPNIWFII
jgi:midasin